MERQRRNAFLGADVGPATDHLYGSSDPCVVAPDAADPCATGRTVQFPGIAPESASYPDYPPSLEAMLLNSWDGGSPADIPEDALLSATHIVARGRFKDGSLRCEQYPVINPGWAVDYAALGMADPPEEERVVAHSGIDHWMCFAELSVHEYLAGVGGGEVIVNLAAAAVPLDSGVDIRSVHDEPTLDMYRAAVADHFFGSDWVVWLGPSYSVAVESWTAYSLWDVQRGDDGVVRVVSPVAEHYDEDGLTGNLLDHLRAPLTDFRRDIKAAHESRVGRTSGRIGVGTDTPELVTDVFGLGGYYEDVGAYGNPIATPAPPPARPYSPPGLRAQLWNYERPEVGLAWQAPPGSFVDSYKIVRTDGLGNEVTIAEAVSPEFTEFTDQDLPLAGMEYTYTVFAVNEHGESAPSASVTVLNGAPNAPTRVRASLQPLNKADVAWSAPESSYVTGYRVRRKAGYAYWVTVFEHVGAEVLEVRDIELKPGTTYRYQVVALNEWSESKPSAPYSVRVP